MSPPNPNGRSKHIPIRTCIGCRQSQGKRTLIRLVRTAEGICIDPTGKQSGRGAYVHRDPACLEAALKGGRLEQALRTTISAEHRSILLESLRHLASESENKV
jgi:hypothetical protein